MKNYYKYSILATLILVTIIGITFAQPVPIGSARQPNPFESNPSAYTAAAMGTVTDSAKMWDGDLTSYCQFSIGSGFASSGNLVVKSFDVPHNTQFTIGWVDLKIKYQVPLATDDDLYRIEYSTDNTNWVDLVSDTTEAFVVAGNPPPVVPFAQITPTDAGAWDWTKLGALQVRVVATRGAGFSWDGRIMRIQEVFATVYPLPLPPTSSPTVSIQPVNGTTGATGVYGPNYYFVDVYVMDMVEMLGYEIVIGFDPGVLTPIEAMTYMPFKSEVFAPVLGADYVSMAYYTTGGDPIGLWGNGPIARIYFLANNAPTSDQSPLTFNVCKISDITGAPIAATVYDGMFEVAKYLSGAVGPGDPTPIPIDVTAPVGTHWHETYPTYSLEYDILDWEDNGDGELSYCDKIELAPGEWYHVEEVTITIWWTIKAGDPYGWDGMPGAAEPEMPCCLTEDMEPPIGTKWHQIFMPEFYSLTFTITSWEDTGFIPGAFDPSDQFDFEYDFDPGPIHWAHLDAVSTDIIVTPADPPPIPEFPLGISLMMLLAPIVPLAYLWRLRRKVTKQ